MNEFDQLKETTAFISSKINIKPEVGMILGSGLGDIADEIESPTIINYEDIPNFPVSTVEGHDGKLVIGNLDGKKVCIFKGRFHYYEGYPMTKVILPVRIMKLLGINDLLVTNAAGGINQNYKPGDLVLIKDHISSFCPNPLRGPNYDELGPRFNDSTNIYKNHLQKMAMSAAKNINIDLKEGVYIYFQGPSYETPADIRMAKLLGADVVGMSTVPETTAAAHCNMNVLCISCITNAAAGIMNTPLSHKEVMEYSALAKNKFIQLIKTLLVNWKVKN